MISKEAAATMMGVPITWVEAMIEIGALTPIFSKTGGMLIDEEELIRKGFVDPSLERQAEKLTAELVARLGGRV